MRRIHGLLLAGIVFAFSTAQAGDGEKFFNGKDLAGFEGLVKVDDGKDTFDVEAAKKNVEKALRVHNDKVATTKLALIAARKLANDAEANSAAETLALVGVVAAERALAELAAQGRYLEKELASPSSRWIENGFWSVKNGEIVGSSPNGLTFNTFLCSKKKYGDFEMKFQVKMTKTGNSGIQIRSHIHNMKTFAVTGPQCDMGGPYWGSLYGENFGGMMKAADAKLVAKILKEGEFNDYAIKAVGKHITIKLNGETTVDADFPKAPDEGIIAFQLHGGPPMEVVFRNLEFTDLKKAAK